MVYNEKDDQIFIQLEANVDPVEFLLTKQPLKMIQAKFVNKEEVRKTVENRLQPEIEKYYMTFERTELGLAITVSVKIDDVLRIVENVEALIF